MLVKLNEKLKQATNIESQAVYVNQGSHIKLLLLLLL